MVFFEAGGFNMGQRDQPVSFRLSRRIIKDVQNFRSAQMAANPGLHVSLSEALRMLIVAGVNATRKRWAKSTRNARRTREPKET